MSHGGGEEGGENSERWLVSYSDFITLLMVLFVVLYSMGQVDVEKYKRLAESMRTAFSLGGPVKVVDSQINESGGTVEDGEAKPIVVPGIPKEPPKSEEVAGQLTEMLAGSDLGAEVSVQTNIEGVLISLSEKLIFSEGTAELPSEVYPILDTIATMIRPLDNNIRLVGHTDNTAPKDSRFGSNMELSLMRALVVSDYLVAHGIRSDRIIVSGRGEHDPIFPNDTAEHRALNGRVDIIIVYQVENSVIGIDNINLTP
ncbi:MAG TPA: flagellar motor protein MotB [Anaerolineaceae bacterium]|nr:flagellar motor protein MotB [Anaerolineaceae bacterium]